MRSEGTVRIVMPTQTPMARLTILVDAVEQWHDTPLYTVVLDRARRAGLAAAVAYDGDAPGGPQLTADGSRPVVVTIVDERSRIERFLDGLDDIMLAAVALVDDVADGAVPREPERAGATGRGRRESRPVDPAEPWEMAAPDDLPPSIDGVIRRPRCVQDLPPGALRALTDALGPLELHDLAVVPAGVRKVGAGRNAETVVTQVVVLGFGAESAGLWTLGRVWRVLPYRDLMVIRDEQILLYGRLSLVGAGTRLSVRYNTVFRSEVGPLLRTVRERAAVCWAPLPALPDPGPLPYKWERLVAGPISRLDGDEPVAVLTGARREGRTTRMVAAVVVSARELVVMVEPDRLSRYGVDAYYLPRAGLTQVGAVGPTLRLEVNGGLVDLDVGSDLARAACLALVGASTP